MDDPNVKYYSWGASYSPGWFDPMRWSHDVIESVEGENDGLVSVESSKWGEFQGVLVGCSHVDLCVSLVVCVRHNHDELMDCFHLGLVGSIM